MTDIEVSSLHYYPIKSCAAIDAQTVEIGERGFMYDREWMVANDKAAMITQRTNPELALVRVAIDGDRLCVAAPKLGELSIPLDETELPQDEVAVNVFKKPGTGIDQGPQASDFFSSYLGKSVKLLRIKQARQVNPLYLDNGALADVSFADGFPITLGSQASLDELNRHLDVPVTFDRFRVNIVAKGEALEPYDEDYWQRLSIGGLRHIWVARANARCPIPNIDQNAGVLSRERPVTDALRATRSGYDHSGVKGEFMCENLTYGIEPGATISVGDMIRVAERAATRNVTLHG